MESRNVAYVWEEHHDKTKESWRLLFESNKFTDVTLVCGDQKTIEAHRLILSACSPVFAKILDQNTSSHPWIYLRGIDYEELKSIIEFIYLGASSLESSKVNEFFEIAADLEVSSITKSQESARRLFNEETSSKATETMEKNSKPLPPTLDDVNVDSEEEMDETESSPQELNIVDDSFVDSYGVPVFDEEDNQPKFKMEPKSIRRTKSFNCNICSAKYASKGGVQLHIRLKHGQLDVSKKTEKIDESIALETKKPNISDFYQLNENNLLTCLICGATATTPKYIENHLTNKHECQWEVFHCEHCNEEFTSQQKFQKHSCNSKEIQIPRDTSCDEYGYEAENILDLKQHTKAKHQATRFKCNLCNFRASEKSALKMHIMQVHIGKTFTCIRCNFSTKKKAQLKVHLKEAHPDVSAINLDKENMQGLNQLLQYDE